jgi:hypothetical protein
VSIPASQRRMPCRPQPAIISRLLPSPPLTHTSKLLLLHHHAALHLASVLLLTLDRDFHLHPGLISHAVAAETAMLTAEGRRRAKGRRLQRLRWLTGIRLRLGLRFPILLVLSMGHAGKLRLILRLALPIDLQRFVSPAPFLFLASLPLPLPHERVLLILSVGVFSARTAMMHAR